MAFLTISHRASWAPNPKQKRLQHSYKTVEWNVQFSKVQRQTVPQTRAGSGKTANTVTIVCETRYICPGVSWTQTAHSNRWCKVTLVGQVGRRSFCKHAVDQRRQLEHNTSYRRTNVMCPHRPKPVTRQAPAFWTDCRPLKSPSVMPQYSTLQYSSRLLINACVVFYWLIRHASLQWPQLIVAAMTDCCNMCRHVDYQQRRQGFSQYRRPWVEMTALRPIAAQSQAT